jgi:hypothetical protein
VNGRERENIKSEPQRMLHKFDFKKIFCNDVALHYKLNLKLKYMYVNIQLKLLKYLSPIFVRAAAAAAADIDNNNNKILRVCRRLGARHAGVSSILFPSPVR